jgi:di/tricarboxylate transporter
VSEIAITFLTVAVVVVLFVTGRVPVEVVAIGAALVLWATGVLSVDQVVSGFGDPAVIFIATLFVVSEGLDATGVTTWVGQRLIGWAGEGRARLITLMMLIVALLTALISVNGAVAALLPVVIVMAIRLGRPTSQLLIPLVFGAHAGSLLTLTGTPVHVLVSEASRDAGGPGFGYFEFALVGIPVLVVAIAVVVVAGERLLPHRTPAALPPDLSRHARTLVEQYGLTSDVVHLRIRADSPWIGQSADALDLAGEGVTLVGIQHSDGPDAVASAGSPPRTIAVDDVALMRGEPAAVAALAVRARLALRSTESLEDLAGALVNRRSGIAEVVIPPRSGLIGRSVFPGMATDSGDLLILAIQRGGTSPPAGKVVLAAGDTMLLQGTWDALDVNLADPDVIVVDAPEAVRRQAVPMGPHAREAMAVLGGMVVLLATGVVPAVVAGLLAALAMVVLRVVAIQQAYRSINWTTVVLVGAMFPISTAMVQSGAADAIADGLVEVVGDAGPYALLAGLFAITAVFGQLISNTATALIMIPVAVAAATGLGVSIQPVLMSLTVAAAAAFLTPVATPVNLMVMGPGGYRFGDYWKLGVVLLAIFFVAAVFLVPVFWPFLPAARPRPG